jgi:hypothetical protein
MNGTLAPTTSPVLTIKVFEAHYLVGAEHIVAEINRKAAKKGMESRLTTAHSTWTRMVPSDLVGFPAQPVEMATFVVLGRPPVIGGWVFAATLAWDEEAGCITRVVPGSPEVDLSAHRATPQHCDHCRTSRRRHDTFVVVHEVTGEQQQIGRSCLRDFLGLDPTTALWVIDADRTVSDDVDDVFTTHASGNPRSNVVEVLAVASACIALHGWVAKSAPGTPTSHLVSTFFFPPTQGKGREDAEVLRAQVEAHLAGDTKAAQRAVDTRAWVLANTETGEYMTNLRAVLGSDTVDMVRNLGLAVSAVSAYGRAQGREIERAERAAAQAAAPASVHVGAVKERLRNLPLTLSRHPMFFDGEYGTSTLLQFTDEAGNVFKWFASGTRDTFAQGDKVTVTGTVKAHEVYQGQAQTALTRCVVDVR